MKEEQREGHVYAMIDGKKVYMEDFIMNPGPDEKVIFLNGDPTDCSRENMRIVKKQENN